MQSSDPREIKIKVGFGDTFKELTVRISDRDIPPYPVEEKLSVVGKPENRVDAVAKVTGKARYTYDQAPAGLLYGQILRSPHANANIKSIDTSAAEKMPGVKAVLSFDETFRTRSVRYAGEGVAAVAAETEVQAEEALRAIQVDYEVLPFAVTKEVSMKDGAPQVGRNDQKNMEIVSGSVRRRRGESEEDYQAKLEARQKEVDALLAKSHKVVKATFETQVQTHSPLETHGVVCSWEDGKLLCYCSTQATFGVRREMTSGRGSVRAESAEVICEFVGGGFGGKFSASREGAAGALLAKAAGQPVKLMLNRREEQTDAGNRPDSRQELTLGLKSDGKIEAYRVRSWGTPGAGTRGAGANNDRVYNFGVVDKIEYGVRTNCGGARALRAPGHPQGVFAAESLIEMAAEALDMDPIDLRKKNDDHPIRQAEYDIARAKSGWDEKRNKKPGSQSGTVKTGMGVGTTLWYAAGGGGAKVLVRIHKNGGVEVRNGAQDIGTGTRTIMGQVAAEELGLPLKDVQTFIGNTNDPQGPASGGSTTGPTIMPAARVAAHHAKQELLEVVADRKGWKAEELDLAGGHVVRRDGAALPESLSFRKACALMDDDQIEVLESRPVLPPPPGQRRGRPNYAGLAGTNAGVQVAEVEVDTETGNVRVKKVTAVADSGKIINPKLAESQVRGGVIQGCSYALFERRIMDRQEGRMVNADFENYKILGTKDMPEIDVSLLDVYMGHNNTHCMGLGEPPVVATAAAVANAVSNAIGVRITSLPITPKKVLAALGVKEARGMKPFKMALPKTLEGAISSSSWSFNKTKLLAGGTDLLGELKERTQTPEMVVNLKGVAGLNEIRQTDRGLEIGALVTLTDLAENAEIRRGWPALVETIHKTATPHIRNVATVGGNLCQRPRCWYYRDESYPCLKKGGKLCYAQDGENEYHSVFDNDVCAAPHPSNLAPVLIAYGAQIEIAGKGGKTRSLGVEDFYVSPKRNPTKETVIKAEEVLSTVILPSGSDNPHSAYVETRDKESYDWATCGATVNLSLEGPRVREARVVLSAVAPSPMRRPDLEKMLTGQTLDDALIARVGEAAAQGATPLEQNGFKVALVKVVTRRAIQNAWKGAAR